MAITDVIKYEGDNKTFVWLHPTTDFNNGSKVIVHESQEALFMVNGEVVEKFGTGSHYLETQNLPIAKKLLSIATGGKNAFHAECYFVNLTEQMAIKWGTDSRMGYIDPEYNFPIDIGACGEMSLSVSNSQKLLVKVVGAEKNLSQEQLTKFFRAFLMNRVKSIIPAIIIENKINIFSIDQHIAELSEIIKAKLQDDFFDYGVNLRNFLITVINKPEEDPNYEKFKTLHYNKLIDVQQAELKQKIAIIEQRTKAEQTVIEAEAMAKKRELESYTYQQEKGFEVAKEIAGNDAVGQMNNVGIGLGMATGVGAGLGGQVSKMAMSAFQNGMENSPSKIKRCSNCGRELSLDAVFCDKCGCKLETSIICSNCGSSMATDAVFCPKCGTRRA